MSYNVKLKINTGIDNVTVEDCGNYTYNCAEMFIKGNKKGLSLNELNGKSCEEAIEILQEVFDDMSNNVEKYEKLEPKNGWGDWEGFYDFVKDILVYCKKNPKCFLSIN